MNSQKASVRSVLPNGNIELLHNNAIVVGLINSIKGKSPGLDEIKKLHGKIIEFCVAANLTSDASVIEIL